MTTIRSRATSAIDLMQDVQIKQLSAEHISGAAELEVLCFSEPWSEKSLELLLGNNAIGFAAVLPDGRVAAYGGMLTVLDEGQITNIATASEFRRQGLGRCIMSALEDYARENGIFYLSLEVRESNLAARALYSSLGWTEKGVRKNFYKLPTENAVVMAKKL